MRLRNVTVLAAVFLTALAAAPPAGDDHVPGRLLAQPRLGAQPAAVVTALAIAGARVTHTINRINVHVLQLPEAALDPVAAALTRTGLFTFVERDRYMQPAATSTVPNDPNYPSQWHLPAINTPNAWGITTGSSSVVIAVIDSGADWTHPDLVPNLVTGWNFVSGTSNTQDNAGHGTAVSGTAAAASNNGLGVSGVSWGNRIMPLEVLDATTSATDSAVADAIIYAADHGARIISISLCAPMTTSTLQSAEAYAWNKGSVIFAAAGNSSSSSPNYPAADPNVVAVSATDTNGLMASFSNYGNWIDLAAPGNYILTTNLGGGYGQWYGTSFSTPIAAAVGALVLSLQSGMSASSLVTTLKNNADELGGYTSYNQYYGYGQVDAYKSVLANTTTADTIPPMVSISSPINGTTVSGTVSVQGTAIDNLSVSSIQFYVDGQVVTSSASSAFSFPLNTNNYSNGLHTLMINAYDAAGNLGSASITVTVSNSTIVDTIPPTISITKPVNGSKVSSGNVAITVSSTDNVAVGQVSIYLDGVLACTDATAPYSCNWNTKKVKSGSHTITASAWDTSGNMGTATPVLVYK